MAVLRGVGLSVSVVAWPSYLRDMPSSSCCMRGVVDRSPWVTIVGRVLNTVLANWRRTWQKKQWEIKNVSLIVFAFQYLSVTKVNCILYNLAIFKRENLATH